MHILTHPQQIVVRINILSCGSVGDGTPEIYCVELQHVSGNPASLDAVYAYIKDVVLEGFADVSEFDIKLVENRL